MFRLTREVRFAINDGDSDDQLRHPPSNSYGGYPSLVGYGRFYSLAVTLAGELDPATGYLRNIKDIDDAVRRHVIPAIRADVLGLNATRPLTPFEQPVVALGLLQSVLPQTRHRRRAAVALALPVRHIARFGASHGSPQSEIRILRFAPPAQRAAQR
jgi:hypothetical protein